VTTNEDSSYPPVDLDTDFFASHGSHRAPHSDPLDVEERDPRLALKQTPGAAMRRKELTKYVKVAVGLSAALCLAALVKVAVAGHDESRETGPSSRRQAASQVAPPPQRVTEPAPRPEPPVQAAAQPQPAAPAQESPAPAAPAASAPPPSAPAEQAMPSEATTVQPAQAVPAAQPAQAAQPAPPAQPVETDPAQAGKEKTASRIALERGRLGAAIEAGERSVALDPTDGEAWLILGAAYQEKGNSKDARRCYKACIEQGKRGPKNECAAMLR
jgi:tetratricopeptide (TPR) repeat protein